MLFFFQDQYKTLSPEPESLTPLFSGQDEQRIPRLDSFITTAPIESPNPSPSLPKNHSSDKPITKRQAQAVKQQAPPTVPETDPFDDFDFPVSKNFDTSFSKIRPPAKAYHIDPLFNSNHRQEIEDDAISFPSLPDPPLPAPYARGEQTLDSHPPPPTPPSESIFYNAPPSSLLAPPQVEQPKVKKEQSAKKKKKKRSKTKKAAKTDQEDDNVAANDEENNSANKSYPDMPLPPRPEDTPQPSSESGRRFEELYRLRGVVSEHV